MLKTIHCRYFQKASAFSVPIGALAGLTGIGGGEFRLPVLMHVIGFDARAAVPLNLALSLITLGFALAMRSHTVPIAAVVSLLPAIAGLIAGGAISALYGTRLLKRFSDIRLIKTIAVLLAGLGMLLLVEVAFPFGSITDLPTNQAFIFALGIFIGLGVGLVSSLLGVAGGELLIPALIFVFGADIRTSGTAAIVISLAIVSFGLWRYHRLGMIPKGRGIRRITTAMSAGSLIGAFLGGMALSIAPIEFLKVLLGLVLLASAVKTYGKEPEPQRP